jgi:hypothetical protein
MDAWLVIRLLTWAFLLPFLKRMLPLKKLAPMMWLAPRDSKDQNMDQKIATVVRWIYIFIFPNETSCIERSLLLYRFLSRCKKDPRLITGMKRTEQGVWKGHAWIELDGKPFAESAMHIQDFRPLISFGPQGEMKTATIDSSETIQ